MLRFRTCSSGGRRSVSRCGESSPTHVPGGPGCSCCAARPASARRRLLEFTLAKRPTGIPVLHRPGPEGESPSPSAALARLAEPCCPSSRPGCPRPRPRPSSAPCAWGRPRARRPAPLGIGHPQAARGARRGGPSSLAVDDAHRLDLPSLEAIVFAAAPPAGRVAPRSSSRRAPAEDTGPGRARLLDRTPRPAVVRARPSRRRGSCCPGTPAPAGPDRGLGVRVGREPPGAPGVARDGRTLPIEPLRIGPRLEQAFGAGSPPSRRRRAAPCSCSRPPAPPRRTCSTGRSTCRACPPRTWSRPRPPACWTTAGERRSATRSSAPRCTTPPRPPSAAPRTGPWPASSPASGRRVPRSATRGTWPRRPWSRTPASPPS